MRITGILIVNKHIYENIMKLCLVQHPCIHAVCCVVISQTHWLVSQERLSPRAGTSVFIDLFPITPSGEWWF